MAERFGSDIDFIGLGYAAHALADYKIGSIDVKERYEFALFAAFGGSSNRSRLLAPWRLRAIHLDPYVSAPTIEDAAPIGPLALARQRASAVRGFTGATAFSHTGACSTSSDSSEHPRVRQLTWHSKGTPSSDRARKRPV